MNDPEPLDTAETTECWCCAASYPQEELIRLGRHPQAALCGAWPSR